ncbi:PQQ-dependent sugar dehydrogenase [Persicitalea jodogahamensis]|uniref:Glucose dehydrogenase n=1 Tax=Persicitalea jodogahamensis TaxID=402147 RepID=A0A8J3GBU8_9BACT|nr:PQQ-dependent sugar dehydrogenase [Persicitalea jodogahamensis]GHB84201.1 glucose dehydrogenase [Persicitalea jodogahamensis]
MTLSIHKLLAWSALFVLVACGNGQDDGSGNPVTPTPPGAVSYKVAEAFPGLKFADPVELVNAGDGTNRLFVVEQAGTIRFFNAAGNPSSATLFLDIKNKVKSGGEMGLLGLAFHPDFKSNGYIYVNYTRDSPRESVVARYRVSNPATGAADAGSETILLTYEQPYSNHNGGAVHFGPDGYLYVSTGDGGSGGDPKNNAQDKTSLLGKILRLDVNATGKGNYGIPADNPFRGDNNGTREEIYAYGLRNPWRISFDPATNKLWAADVGQNQIEEIDIIEKGGNYGWRLKEADDCFNPKNNCQEAGLIDPVWDYTHANGDISITGGYVYRGKKLPDLVGKYVYGDYASGRIWALEVPANAAAKNDLVVNKSASISAFGVDEQNELYFFDYSGGKILTLTAAE